MAALIFPKDFLWGVATSAYQIEGAALEDGKGLSIWDTFSHIPGNCYNNLTGDVACDHYHLYQEDIKQMKKLGVNSYRFSFSWSRILPEGTGKVNTKGLDFYKRLVDGLLESGIVPNATIYHWDLPQALQDKGGWANRNIKDWYAEYASLLFREFSGIIPYWATLNEPIAVYIGYATAGIFPPGLGDEKLGKAAMHHAMLAHGEGIKAFRSENMKNGKIGVVVDIWNRHPARDCDEDRALALKENENSYRFFLNGMFKGIYSDYIQEQMKKEKTMPVIMPGDMELMCQKPDFYGLNVYNRVVVSADQEFLKNRNEQMKKKGGNFLDNGNEYYPEAAYDAITMFRNEYDAKMPIIVTENGTPNCNEEVIDGRFHDEDRIRYVNGFLEQIHRAIEEGANVKGYYLWSLLDNYEWSVATSYRFGLLHTDFETQERIWKDSANWYKKIIAENGVG